MAQGTVAHGIKVIGTMAYPVPLAHRPDPAQPRKIPTRSIRKVA
ncbi:MAG: hypothetical protein RIQ99_503 [Pseudomonadota bacterium]|jgi:hypothetical protein